MTRAALELGDRWERVERYESGYVCDGVLYVPYRAIAIPVSTYFQLHRLLGVSAQRDQPRFVEIPLDAVGWRTLTNHSSSSPEVMPRFGEGAIPADPARCETALRIQASNAGLLTEALLKALSREEMVLFESYKAVAVARRAEAGAQWAVVSVPSERFTRTWWAYPARVMAFVPAVVVDVVTFPIQILFANQH